MLDELRRINDRYTVLVSPPFQPDAFQIEDYRDYLSQSDAAVICWGAAPLSWFTRMHHTLLAHLGQSVNMSLRRCAIYNIKPQASFGTPFERIQDDAFSLTRLQPFLDTLHTRRTRGQAT
jgi:hypothetical protein